MFERHERFFMLPAVVDVWWNQRRGQNYILFNILLELYQYFVHSNVGWLNPEEGLTPILQQIEHWLPMDSEWSNMGQASRYKCTEYTQIKQSLFEH